MDGRNDIGEYQVAELSWCIRETAAAQYIELVPFLIRVVLKFDWAHVRYFYWSLIIDWRIRWPGNGRFPPFLQLYERILWLIMVAFFFYLHGNNVRAIIWRAVLHMTDLLINSKIWLVIKNKNKRRKMFDFYNMTYLMGAFDDLKLALVKNRPNYWTLQWDVFIVRYGLSAQRVIWIWHLYIGKKESVKWV